MSCTIANRLVQHSWHCPLQAYPLIEGMLLHRGCSKAPSLLDVIELLVHEVYPASDLLQRYRYYGKHQPTDDDSHETQSNLRVILNRRSRIELCYRNSGVTKCPRLCSPTKGLYAKIGIFIAFLVYYCDSKVNPAYATQCLQTSRSTCLTP